MHAEGINTDTVLSKLLEKYIATKESSAAATKDETAKDSKDAKEPKESKESGPGKDQKDQEAVREASVRDNEDDGTDNGDKTAMLQ